MDNEINIIKESNKKNLLESIRCITGTVIKTALKRNEEDEIRWIDMKFDPVTGKDIYDKNKWYSRNFVYSWIQGRSLETICEFLDFMTDEKVELCSRKELIEVGDSIYEHLKPLVENWEEGKASRSIPFVFDRGLKENSKKKTLYPSISDLFVYKGLLIYAFNRKKEADISSLIQNLRYISRVAVEGNLINDQIDYKTGLMEITPGKNIGLEGNMLAIGSSSLLYKVTKDKKDLDLGFDALLDTLEKHTGVNAKGKTFVIDYIDLFGKPVKTEDGNFENNPGHTLEVCGMGLQFLRENASNLSCRKEYDYIKKKLVELGCFHFKNGLTPMGTVYLGLDINSGKPIKAISPWWSSFESMRTLSEIYFYNRSVDVLDMLFKLKKDLNKVYLERSITGIPIQTVDAFGKIVSKIPATADLDPGYHTAIPLFDVYRLFSNLFAGFSKVNIELEEGVRLQGHAARLGLADGVLDPLSVHAIIMNSGFKRNVVIVCDLIELDQEIVDSLVGEIKKEFGINSDCIMISTIHTHTGPAAIRLGNLKPTKVFKINIMKAVLKAVKKAEKDFEEVKVGVYRNQVEGIGVNRRFLEAGKVVMKPNFKGDIDRDLVTVAFYDNANKLKGLLLQVSLHPTTLGVDIHKYSSDYLGGLYKEIFNRYKVDVVVMQGACGDVRPCILDEKGTEFVDGTYQDCMRIGKKIAEKVDKALENIQKNGVFSINTVRSQKGKCKLKVQVESRSKVLQTLKNSEDMLMNVNELTKNLDSFAKAHDSTAMLLKDDIYWCQEMLENYDKGKVLDYVEADFAFIAFDELIGIAFLPGEAFASIGKRIKTNLNCSEVMICGYYSGSVGYIPNKEAFKEGGYEVDQAFRSYGYAGPFEENVEDQVVNEIMKLNKCGGNKLNTLDKLALFGGSKFVTDEHETMFHWPIVTKEDDDAVLDVLHKGIMSGTEITKKFEDKMAAWLGVKYALGYCNGTAGILGALWACGVGAGDEVICPSMTYWASASPVQTLGGVVNFADIERDTLCIDPNDIEHRIGKRTKVIIVVHYAGQPCNMDKINAIAKKHNILVLEDASHAQGSLYHGKKCGTLGDVSVMSLMTAKSFAIGEAGMLFTNNREIFEKAMAYGFYERTGAASEFFKSDNQISDPELLKYAGVPLGGFKHRMHQMSSAVGLVQLKYFDQRSAENDKAMRYFWNQLKDIPQIKPHMTSEEGCTMGGWYYPLGYFDSKSYQEGALKKICKALTAEGVPSCSPAKNKALHLHPAFNNLDLFRVGKPTAICWADRDVRQGKGACPNSEDVQNYVFSVPWFKHFDKEVIDEYVGAFHKVFAQLDEILK